MRTLNHLARAMALGFAVSATLAFAQQSMKTVNDDGPPKLGQGSQLPPAKIKLHAKATWQVLQASMGGARNATNNTTIAYCIRVGVENTSLGPISNPMVSIRDARNKYSPYEVEGQPLQQETLTNRTAKLVFNPISLPGTLQPGDIIWAQQPICSGSKPWQWVNRPRVALTGQVIIPGVNNNQPLNAGNNGCVVDFGGRLDGQVLTNIVMSPNAPGGCVLEPPYNIESPYENAGSQNAGAGGSQNSTKRIGLDVMGNRM